MLAGGRPLPARQRVLTGGSSRRRGGGSRRAAWRDIKPDQVKALLERTARPIPGADPLAAGAGLLDVGAALSVKDKPAGAISMCPTRRAEDLSKVHVAVPRQR